LAETINITKKSTENLLNAIKEIVLEVSAEETNKARYMLMSRHQTTGQIHYLKAVSIISKLILGKINFLSCGLDSSGSEREGCRALMNTVMNLRVP
jgi:hypothetical protein